MSRIRNLLGAFVPVRERRESFASLAALNAEVVHDVNGDEAAMIYILGGGATLNATFEITGSADGINFHPVIAFPMTTMCQGGTIPLAAQPLLTEAVNAANVIRCYAVNVGQLKKLRLRLSVYTGGACDVQINSEAQASIHPNAAAQKAATLFVSATGAVSVATTATLPAVTGMRHYIDFVKVTRSATAALTASATPVLVTTTNLPGAPVLTFGSDAGGIGIDKDVFLDFGASGLAATALGTATTIVCPIYTGVIWRVNVAYRLGL
jgi:hypothetical protein